ncbi:MAG: hypothetical protein RL497_2708, partial [Pseudomonadota bacterium]
MNRFETDLGRKLLRASLLPLIVLACILLAVDIIALHHSQRSAYQNSFELAQRLLTKIEALTERPVDTQQFTLLANILLSDTHIVGVSLINDKNHVIHQAGIPAQLHASFTDAKNISTAFQNDGNTIIKIPNTSQTWVLALDDERIEIALYQNLLIHLALFGTIFLFFIFIYSRTKTKFFGPIRALTHYLLSLKLTPHHAIPSQTELTYLHNCALLINELIDGLNRSQDDMRLSYEAALNDFKESLESVEVQNVEMNLARKSAVQAERVKSEFLIHASSDLLDPLRQCLSAIGQLALTRMDAEQADYMHNLEITLRGVIGLAQDIVDFSRLENGKFQLEVKNIQIRQVIHDALTFYAPLAAAKNSRVLSIIQPDVCEVLLGDPRRLQQVLGNLINKVLNYGEQGDLALNVSVLHSEPSSQLIKFRVIDSNGGFKADFIQQFKWLLENK